jgi:sigma-B regulation protein RsbU (phosphoserine phosphatase)
MVYVNAGHNRPLWYRCREDCLIELVRTGPALGVYDERAYAQQCMRLDPGDFVLFYTDGVTDALNPAEEDYGEERLREVVLEHCRESAEEIAGALEESVWGFMGQRVPEDDITIMLVKRL